MTANQFFRRAAATGLIVVCLLVALVAVSFGLNTVRSVAQDARDGAVQSEIRRVWISAAPNGEPLATTRTGQDIYFNIDRYRSETCYIDIDWRWTNTQGEVASSYAQDGGRAYAVEGHLIVAEHVDVPASAVPGKYTVTRVAQFNCGQDEPAYAVTSAEIEIR